MLRAKILSEIEEAASCLQRHIEERGSERPAIDAKRRDEITAMKRSLTAQEDQFSSFTGSLFTLKREKCRLSRESSQMTNKAASLEKEAEVARS